MTRTNPLALLASAALLLAGAAQAQIYRHVGPDGRVSYSGQPSAADSRATGGKASAGGAALPYELSQTAQRYPVTLYTSNNCAACNTGRNLLISRGIPFSEKTVESNDDIAALQRLSGGNDLPVLTIGQQRLNGFSDQEWSQYLDAAGYPKTSQLPASYRRPSATQLVASQPVAPAFRADTAGTEQQEPAPTVTPAPDRNNPAGIRF
ncbi:MAG: glutaredoxin family protein [Desulfovibrionaceae bacterium]|jgi:glutaredoxin|nr:glutaredoxin family protein [Desulfovibrionaceae bacterium]